MRRPCMRGSSSSRPDHLPRRSGGVDGANEFERLTCEAAAADEEQWGGGHAAASAITCDATRSMTKSCWSSVRPGKIGSMNVSFVTMSVFGRSRSKPA